MPVVIEDKIGTKTFKEYLEYMRGVLRIDRQPFDSQWQDLGKFLSPRRVRFNLNEKNRGETNPWNQIINNIATTALRIAVSGMFAGNMSPARPWFVLEHGDDQVMERDDVKVWFRAVEKKMLSVLRESNFYNMAPTTMEDLLAFGTGLLTHVDDDETIARFYSHPVGSYYLGLDEKLNVSYAIREFTLTVYQVVAMFGLENVSSEVRSSYDAGNYKVEVAIIHHLMKNMVRQSDNPFALGKPYIGVYYETGMGKVGARFGLVNQAQKSNDFLRVEGFHERPFNAPRWSVTGEDTYATKCPGMLALGDTKQLQTEEIRKGQAIDKQTSPPLQAPPGTKDVNSLPGGVTYLTTGINDSKGITTLYDVNINLADLRADIDAVENRIKGAFFVPLFLAITEMEGIQPRNEFELVNRHDEALLQLGPVLQQIQGEFLSPIVERVFAQLQRADDNGRNGILPPLPDILDGAPLTIRYISTLAQAQRAVATQAMDRTVGFVGRLAELNPGVVEKVDSDWAVEEYGRVVGVHPKLFIDDDTLAQQRAERAEMQRRAQEAELAASEATTAKQLSETKTSGDNALAEIAGG